MSCKCGHTFAEHCGPSRAVECSVLGCACQGFDEAAASETAWFICKGCGQPASYFGAGLPPWYPPGSVGHSKPIDQLRSRGTGEPSRVKCALYQQLSAAAFWDLHREAERIEAPLEFKPVLG